MRKLLLIVICFTQFFNIVAQDSSPTIDYDTLSVFQQIDQYNQKGKEHYSNSEFSEALLSFNKGLKIAESTSDSLFMAKLNSNIGVIHDMLGDFGEALLHYQKSLIIYDRLNNAQGKESVLNNLGVVYEEMNMPKKALVNFFLALEIKNQMGKTKNIGSTYNNIAIIYENHLKDTDSAYYFYNKALESFILAGNEPGIALIKGNLGIICLRQGELEKARIFIDQSLELFQSLGNQSDYASALYYKGILNKEESKYNEALNYFLKAVELAEEFNIKKLQSRIYLDMAKVYKKQEKYKDAMDFFEKHMKVKFELMNFEKIRQIHNMEMSYYVEKKEYEIELLHSNAKLKSSELVWMRRSLYFLILIVVLGVIIAILNRHKDLLKQKQELLLLESRLFRSQVTPHFVFNSLMSIQVLLMENKVETASTYLIDFAKLIRSILQNTRKSLVPLDQEIMLLKQYLSLEKLRFGDKFDIDFRVNIPAPEEIQFPPMLSQPFIENAIVHGLLPADKPGLLKVEFNETNKTFFLVIEDNGVGREQAALKQKSKDHKPMAIEITEQRIRLVAKRFNINIGLEIIDLKDEEGNATGTRVVFKMALD